MHYSSILAAGFFASLAASQNLTYENAIRRLPVALLNLTFSESADPSQCATQDDTDGLFIAITSVPDTTIPTCFNLNQTFSEPNVTYSERGYSCPGNTLCGVRYTVVRWPVPFPTDRNFSQIYYKARTDGFMGDENEEPDEVARMRFIAYNGLDCRQIAGEDGVIQPYWDYNCNSLGSCNSAGYSVRSFSISAIDRDNVGDDDCSLAERRGGSVNAGTGNKARESIGFLVLGAVFTGLAFVV